MITVNMDKAKEIQRNNLRKERAPLLAALDVEFMRAVENNDATLQETIREKKQLLRDAPSSPEIDAAQTPDELKAVTLPNV